MSEQAAENTFGTWTSPQVPLTIDYPIEVLDEIRATVCDGLQQLAHGGLEVGGVLFGARRGDEGIRILTWRSMPCEHAHGPALRLSERDRAGLALLLEVAKSDADLQGLQPVGWFLSHARSDIFLNISDLETYNQFFPEPWQVALVLRPSRLGTARAGFFVREAGGTLKADSSYRDFNIEPLHRPAVQRDLPVPAGDQRATPRPEPPPRPASIFTAAPAPEISPETESPRFPSIHPKPVRRSWMWAVPVLLALLGGGLLIKTKYFTPLPKTLAFRAYNAGDTVHLEWDQNSPIVKGARQAALDITEGGVVKHYALTPDQLQDGRTTYTRKAGDLEMRMTVYPASGQPIQEFARLVGPATVKETHPDQPVPPEANQLREELDQLRSDLHDKESELRKERARADKLQETVRILENRIAVDAARGLGPDAKKP